MFEAEAHDTRGTPPVTVALFLGCEGATNTRVHAQYRVGEGAEGVLLTWHTVALQDQGVGGDAWAPGCGWMWMGQRWGPTVECGREPCL